jgi:hypothetical protein
VSFMKVIDLATRRDISCEVPGSYAETFFNAALGDELRVSLFESDERGLRFVRHRCSVDTDRRWDSYEEVAPGCFRSRHWNCGIARRDVTMRFVEIVPVRLPTLTGEQIRVQDEDTLRARLLAERARRGASA